jgi:hypothetical protein
MDMTTEYLRSEKNSRYQINAKSMKFFADLLHFMLLPVRSCDKIIHPVKGFSVSNVSVVEVRNVD